MFLGNHRLDSREASETQNPRKTTRFMSYAI